MPNWQPNWHNVQWDEGRARVAAQALRSTADRLDEQANQRRADAVLAQYEWRGRFRMRFDDDLQQLLARSGRLAQDLRNAAAQIDRATDRAREEQAHRESERRRWQREREREEEEHNRR